MLAQIQREVKSNALDELMKQMSNMEIIQFLFEKVRMPRPLEAFQRLDHKNKVSLDLET